MTYDNDGLGDTCENKEDLTKHMEKAGRKALTTPNAVEAGVFSSTKICRLDN